MRDAENEMERYAREHSTELENVSLILTCTTHGKPYWRFMDHSTDDPEMFDPNIGIINKPPIEIISATKLFNDQIQIDLDDPLTWFVGTRALWIDRYLGGNLQLERATPAQIGIIERDFDSDLGMELLGEAEGYFCTKSLGPFDDLMENGSIKDFFLHLEGEELAVEPLSSLSLEADKWACTGIYNRPECDLRTEMDAIDDAEGDSELAEAIKIFYERWPESHQRYNESLLYQ